MIMRRKSIVEILMERDGLTKKQAKNRLEECREVIYAALDDGADWEVEDIVEDYLGLGPGYVDEII